MTRVVVTNMSVGQNRYLFGDGKAELYQLLVDCYNQVISGPCFIYRHYPTGFCFTYLLLDNDRKVSQMKLITLKKEDQGVSSSTKFGCFLGSFSWFFEAEANLSVLFA